MKWAGYGLVLLLCNVSLIFFFQNESSEEKPIETPVGTTTEEDGNGCEAQNIKPDEGEAVVDDGGNKAGTDIKVDTVFGRWY